MKFKILVFSVVIIIVFAVQPSDKNTIVVKLSESYIGRTEFDCSAFTQSVYHDMGIQIPRTSCEQADAGEKVYNISELQEGDIICMGVSSESISHVGIFCGKDVMIHDSALKGEITSVSLSEWIANDGWGTPYQFAVRVLK